MRILFLYL
jgi:Tn3 transposase DDE domain